MELFRKVRHPQIVEVMEAPIRSEIYSIERMEEFAQYLAEHLTVDLKIKKLQPLIARNKSNSDRILESYKILIQTTRGSEYTTPGAEWFIDNFHIIEEQIREIQKDLPSSYYKELPRLGAGDLFGYPRVYAIALALIAHTDSNLSVELIRQFVNSFQRKSYLRVGELWALPITLRLALVENIRRLVLRIIWDKGQRNLADQTADRIIETAFTQDRLQELLNNFPDFTEESLETEYSFVAHLVKRLREQEVDVWPAIEMLEQRLSKLGKTSEEIVQLEHRQQAANQVSIANIITSMRLLSNINWKIFFESVSLLDRELAKEHTDTYWDLDFGTRDIFRKKVEKLAKRTESEELAIAERVVLTGQASNVFIGEYLHGGLQKIIEDYFSYKSPWGERIRRLMLRYPTICYIFLMCLIAFAIFLAPLLFLLDRGTPLLGLTIISLIILIPISDMSVNIANFILSEILPPRILGKYELEKGIPSENKTLVIIPSMLVDRKYIREILEGLEVHYLANVEDNLFFALVTDYTDSHIENAPEDQELLELAISLIDQLNEKYPAHQKIFHLFHRKRLWNSHEGKWIGWERKRGKIEELNKYLRGSRETSFIKATLSYEVAKDIKYVITLDSDTQMGLGTAKKLVGTALYPLNRNKFGIIQPRISVSIKSSSASTFAMINSSNTGLDPYTTAISDIYQDLFDEGIFAGKALYNVDAFIERTEGRFPENRILSHDLIEGSFVRAGFASDIEFIDDYPKSYSSYITRQHRWVRGDWQIAAWILPRVPSAHGSVRNSLSMINRWKIYDNLRRSLVSTAYFLSFVIGWVFLDGSALEWTIFTICLVAIPPVLQLLRGLMRTTSSGWINNFWAELAKLRVHLWQFSFNLIFLAHRSLVEIDAIARALYRVTVSKKKCLEWVPSAVVEKSAMGTKSFWQKSYSVVILCVLVLAGTLFVRHPLGMLLATPFVIAWSLYYVINEWTSKRVRRLKPTLEGEDERYYLDMAQRIWYFFETFVTKSDNWLPPDNVQEDPAPVVAHRTSPTNIGLYLLSSVAAQDLGFISKVQTIQRLKDTLETIQKLEHFEGHLLNWYDTKTLEPLHPKYVSLVDSGNYAAYLVAISQALHDFYEKDFFNSRILMALNVGMQGLISDLAELIEKSALSTETISFHLQKNLEHCQELLQQRVPLNMKEWLSYFTNLRKTLADVRDSILALEVEKGAKYYYRVRQKVDTLYNRISAFHEEAEVLAPCLGLNTDALIKHLAMGGSSSLREVTEHLQELQRAQSLRDFDRCVSNCRLFIEKNPGVFEGTDIQYEKVAKDLNDAVVYCQKMTEQIQHIQALCESLLNSINFKFLLNKDREVFTVGYNVSEGRFDNSYYDLLASEARTASLIAVALRQVSAKHWFRLGRKLVPISGGRALVSWSASMFEYLMPNLIMKSFENTLLDETVQAVVRRQISYGKKLKIPWGVSEAGYNARDLNFNYQYGPFGVPGLGLKRGLGHDLVVSPYSTFLAGLVNPEWALRNLKKLEEIEILTPYGFYESIDYTAERLSETQNFAIVKSFMAHHQGMSLIAVNNILNDNLMQKRFHQDLRIRAVQELLQERIPPRMKLETPKAAAIEWLGAGDALSKAFYRTYTEANHYTPRVQILSNGRYSLTVSTAGAGYSKADSLAMYRWREDSTRDPWGSFIFIRDTKTQKYWSATYNPNILEPEGYRVVFAEDKVDFWRENESLRTHLEVIVAPDDMAELRQLTLTNDEFVHRDIEVTSYCEPVLANFSDDSSHPAFSNLFLQTEYISTKNLLVVRRRPRLSERKERWAFHGVVTDAKVIGDIEYETDRSRFIGRGRDLLKPLAMDSVEPLSNSTGSTLDPILALRIKVRVPGQSSRKVIFSTGFCQSRDEILQTVDRINEINAFDRESKLAWTKARIDLRHLNLDSEAAYLFQRLAEKIIFSDPSLRQPSHVLVKYTREQASLWPYGISGDLPIVAITVYDRRDIAIVRRLLRGHEYLRLKGLIFDFVILTDTSSTYMQDLAEELNLQVRFAGFQGWLNKPGGVFILKMDTMPERDRALIQAMARVVLSTDRGTLREQITRRVFKEKYLSNQEIIPERKEYTNQVLLKPELDYFNGCGGFSKDGTEYIIYLQKNQWTPAPWINVIANGHDFGFQVSESGAGYTWSVNSRENRITSWSNDAVSDSPGECFYIRDEISGEFWSPMPLPIRDENPYLVRHGHGYSVIEHNTHGIAHQTLMYVSMESSVKFVRLRLRNTGARSRKLSVFSYVEWVLGNLREKSAPYILTEVDDVTTAILAKNAYNHEFAERVAFCYLSGSNGRFTCDRKEFIGRNGVVSAPQGLLRRGLSMTKGIGLDPCAVLQSEIDLAPQEEKEVLFLLGQSENSAKAMALVKKYMDFDVAEAEYQSAVSFWIEKLSTIEVKTPERSLDLMLNRWLLYQALVCRMWARSAFYQSGGAYGFRDQLQDTMAFVYSSPEIAREHILRASSRQFPEGDVQHWWHPPTGRGVRTHFSDDLLWMPLVVSHYIRVTGDDSVLDEVTPYIEAPLLTPEQEDSYTQPTVSEKKSTVREHCERAILRSLRLGQHGLPLIGSGDWNDGMNRIGEKGQGESVWMGWFLYKVIHDFADFVQNEEMRKKFLDHAQVLKANIHKNAWDGNWFRRAYFDDGTPVGSVLSEECKIDSISQTWSILSGAGEEPQISKAIEHLESELVNREEKLIKLLKPPFDKMGHDPGYIKGYVPGVRENGGQYTHAAIWVIMAFAQRNESEKALEFFNLINPILHTETLSGVSKYKVEPYVISADVYAVPPHVGRGGWSWYTGSASWFYRAGLESILGFHLFKDRLVIAPCVPKAWSSYILKYRYGKTQYIIHVRLQDEGEPRAEILLKDSGQVENVYLNIKRK